MCRSWQNRATKWDIMRAGISVERIRERGPEIKIPGSAPEKSGFVANPDLVEHGAADLDVISSHKLLKLRRESARRQ